MFSLVIILQPIGGKTLPEKRDEARDSYNKLWDFFIKNRIFFSVDLCKKIDSITDVFWSCLTAMNISQSGDQYQLDEDGLWQESYKKFKEELLPLKEKLENDFRALLE